MKGTLNQDIKSFASKNSTSKIYGKKGEVVEIIKDNGNVFIVELKGDRFAVGANQIDIEKKIK